MNKKQKMKKKLLLVTSAFVIALPILAACGGPKTFKITWKNGDEVLQVDEKVAEGTTPTYTGAVPTQPSSVIYDYTFKGWSPEVGPAKADTTYFAQFDTVAKEFTVTFVDYDEQVLGTQKVKYGLYADFTKVNVPEHPGREYKNAWLPAANTLIKQDTTFTPLYKGKYLENTDLYDDNALTIKIANGSTEDGNKTKVSLNFKVYNKTGSTSVDGEFTINSINGVEVTGEAYHVKKEDFYTYSTFSFEIDGAEWGYVAEIITGSIVLTDSTSKALLATAVFAVFPTGLTPAA